MPRSTDHQFSLKKPCEERNPYAVLNVAPVMISDLRKQLSTALAFLKTTNKIRVVVSDADAEELRNANIVKIEKELKNLETQDSESTDPKREERKVHLERYLTYYREYLALRQLGTSPKDNEDDLQEALEFTSFLPEDDEVSSVTENITRTQVEHMREAFRASLTSLAETLTHPRKSKRYRDLEEASKAINQILNQQAPATGALSEAQKKRLSQLYNVLEAIEAILNVDQDIYGRFRTLAQRFHPDANPGDASVQERFQEVSSAHKKLADANEDERRALAMNLVFGQRTELWTSDMIRAAESIAMQLAPVFALEQPLPGETVPCDECNGLGNIVVQNQDDYFPVPVVCEGCEGYGAIFKSTHELRRVLEALEEKDGKKDDDEEDYEDEDDDEEDYEYEYEDDDDEDY